MSNFAAHKRVEAVQRRRHVQAKFLQLVKRHFANLPAFQSHGAAVVSSGVNGIQPHQLPNHVETGGMLPTLANKEYVEEARAEHIQRPEGVACMEQNSPRRILVRRFLNQSRALYPEGLSRMGRHQSSHISHVAQATVRYWTAAQASESFACFTCISTSTFCPNRGGTSMRATWMAAGLRTIAFLHLSTAQRPATDHLIVRTVVVHHRTDQHEFLHLPADRLRRKVGQSAVRLSHQGNVRRVGPLVQPELRFFESRLKLVHQRGQSLRRPIGRRPCQPLSAPPIEPAQPELEGGYPDLSGKGEQGVHPIKLHIPQENQSLMDGGSTGSAPAARLMQAPAHLVQ